jgi:subtilisin family serine protease
LKKAKVRSQAIDLAVDEWNVHIISLSFGFRDAHNLIDAAIDRAVEKGRLIFAAASNGGGLKSRTRPATKPNILCIHACDGKGNKGDMNPDPLAKAYNFTTLGVGVESRWKKDGEREDVWKSGTSFATAIAAGFAAGILEFANFHCDLTDRQRATLKKPHGIEALFQEMSRERDGYDFVHPMRLWDNPVERSDEEVAKYIEEVIQKLM